jgi:3D (Asp-Asp-Asp) domain-containing protein
MDVSIRSRELVRAGAFLALVALTVWLGTHRRGPAHSAPAPRAGPTWPWMPGGFLAPKPGFSAVPFAVKTSNDPSLPKGVTLVKTPGEEGVLFGLPGKPALYATPPKPAAVLRGTATAHVLVVGKTRYTYVRVLSLLATAYNGSYAMNGPWGGVAAWNGEPLQHGDVAVDPSVIPLGTHLYVSGYGPATAADTGSGIVGERIDLYFPESATAISRFGEHMVKVYVLAPPGT